jgi:hypothetical protein
VKVWVQLKKRMDKSKFVIHSVIIHREVELLPIGICTA